MARVVRALAMTCAVSAVLAVATPGVAQAKLDKDEKTVIGILAAAYNNSVQKGKWTPDTDQRFDTKLREAAKDWKESYVTIRELFDAQTGGLGEFHGSFDLADIADGNTTRVAGWACVPKHPFAHLNIEVYEDGTAPGRMLGTVSATLPREPAVAALCGNTADHGFDGPVAGVCTTPGTVIALRIDAYVVDPEFPTVRQSFPPKTGSVTCR